MLNNKNFYPTPDNLIASMVAKLKNKNPKYILEPSAGKGDIVKYLQKSHVLGYGRKEIKAIELDDNLYSLLKGKDIDVIDRDFLAYNGGDIFDLIIMNPPFSSGDKHLLKAIDLLYSGEIICLLNAETIKNPYSETRKELCSQLAALGADIEYRANAFNDAERQTNVEIAIVHIHVERDIETELLDNAKDKIKDEDVSLGENEDANIALNDSIGALEVQYNLDKQRGKDAIIGFYKSGCTSHVEIKVGDCSSNYGKMQENMQEQINLLNKKLRRMYWDKALSLPKIKGKMTSSNRDKFHAELQASSHLEFTANNVRDFAINLIGSYEQTLIDACVELFDDWTHKYSYESETDKNRLHFTTWKTNEAFKVNKKVIKPMYGSYGGYGEAFRKWGKWELNYGIDRKLDDIDKVMNYFTGHKTYRSISDAVKTHMNLMNCDYENSTKCESTFFKIKFFKKGTIHLEFKDLALLRKFNIVACKGKGWLPNEYGTKTYDNFDSKDKQVVDSFEGKKSYNKNIDDAPVFAKNDDTLQIELEG